MPTITVNGMHCENCKKAVTEAIGKVPGTSEVLVNLQKGQATWQDIDPTKPASLETIKQAVETIGFEAS